MGDEAARGIRERSMERLLEGFDDRPAGDHLPSWAADVAATAGPEEDAPDVSVDPLRKDQRERLILEHLPLVHGLARRYANRGEPLDDLVQVGTVGLIKAIDRYDPSRGNKLASFATPTILGEIRRHFRDRSWSVRVPRGIQEARAGIAHAMDDLSAGLGRSPSIREIAEAARLTEEEVLDALAAGSAQRPASLSGTGPDAEGDDAPVDIGVTDTGFEQAEARVALRDGLGTLPARERVILHLRFDEGLTQSEIAARVGISQMHVSRLIRRSLDALRAQAGEGLVE